MTGSPVLELRQYTLKPGRRDALIELFDREFIESQEELGCTIVGQFRDLGNPDRFVWLREFPDLQGRPKTLAAFYGGPVWKLHREAANATMLDSDNVLLLRPVRLQSGFNLEGQPRPPNGPGVPTRAPVVATVFSLRETIDEHAAEMFERQVIFPTRSTEAPILAYYVRETAPNNFPALPIREGENVLVAFSRTSSPVELGKLPSEITALLAGPPEVLRLSPTTRSRLAG